MSISIMHVFMSISIIDIVAKLLNRHFCQTHKNRHFCVNLNNRHYMAISIIHISMSIIHIFISISLMYIFNSLSIIDIVAKLMNIHFCQTYDMKSKKTVIRAFCEPLNSFPPNHKLILTKQWLVYNIQVSVFQQNKAHSLSECACI